MNSRDRVLAAINHESLDRFPLDIGGPISGISKIAYDRYLQKYAPTLYPSDLCDKFQQLACIHEEILQRWKVDTRHICAGFHRIDIDENHYYDGFGVKHRSVFSPHYNQIIYFNQVDWPLKNTHKIEDIENFNWPQLKEGQVGEVIVQAKKLRTQGEYAVILDAPTGGVMECATWLVGLKAFFSELFSHLEFFEYLLDQIANALFVPYWQEVLVEGGLGEYVDIVLIGDDFGMQDRMIISPKLFRELVKPKLKTVVTSIKGFADVKVMLHSCGSIYPIIGDLIDIGFDILNPLQPQAIDMDHQTIKTQYREKLCFHGGVDIQRVMPRGTPQEVQEEVQRAFDTLGADGTGYIRATAHNILADVQPENIQAYTSVQG